MKLCFLVNLCLYVYCRPTLYLLLFFFFKLFISYCSEKEKSSSILFLLYTAVNSISINYYKVFWSLFFYNKKNILIFFFLENIKQKNAYFSPFQTEQILFS